MNLDGLRTGWSRCLAAVLLITACTSSTPTGGDTDVVVDIVHPDPGVLPDDASVDPPPRDAVVADPAIDRVEDSGGDMVSPVDIPATGTDETSTPVDGFNDVPDETNVDADADATADSGDAPTSDAMFDTFADTAMDAGDAAEEVFVPPCGTCASGTVCVWGTGTCESAMVTVPAGVFKMGCWGVYPYCNSPGLTDTLPAHEVDVPEFQIDRLEVTNAEYRVCVDAGECSVPYEHLAADFPWLTSLHDPVVAAFPVVGVNWYQAKTFCEWKGKRMCSEAEWEKAARGTKDDRYFPWGWGAVTCKYATTFGNKSDPNTQCDSTYWYPDCIAGCGNGDWEFEPVGSHPLGASPYGVLDMTGNAKEWVEDYYHNTYAGAPADGSPWLDSTTGLRVVRDWLVFTRESAAAALDALYSGIRCCRDVEPRSGP